ncbi:MAG: ATP-binding protein [Actinobacteria bacterium]|nr:ATP-binding protein [Actinomycetota bacterium]
MDPVLNPYSPGAGRPPGALVGRGAQLTAWDTALKRVTAGRDAQSIVLYGLRGVGKTVLLSRFARIARENDWIVAQVEAKSQKSMRDMVGEALHDRLVDLARPGVGARVLKALKTALSFKASYDATGNWTFGLDLSDAAGGGADTGTFESDLGKLLRDLNGAAEEQGVGIALLVDEAQDLPHEELIALCSIVHAANQRQERLVLALAGLPSLPRKLAEAKSYAERLFNYHLVDALSEDDAAAALRDPARSEDVAWQHDAVGHVVGASGGYPYFLQQFGQDTWNVASASPIVLADARLGVATGEHALDTGFFRIRWDRATTAEKDYLRAMAVDGDGGSSSGTVAARLGKKVTALGPVRANLINKGLIYSPDHGVVAYTVPAMAAFITRQLG